MKIEGYKQIGIEEPTIKPDDMLGIIWYYIVDFFDTILDILFDDILGGRVMNKAGELLVYKKPYYYLAPVIYYIGMNLILTFVFRTGMENHARMEISDISVMIVRILSLVPTIWLIYYSYELRHYNPEI